MRARRPTDEGGFALIIAMFVLLIVSVLVATAIAVASQTSTSTTRDANSKAALEAAEAGLQVATFRLSRLEPAETACVTGTRANPTSGVYCAGFEESESLGNGATFEYWTSEALAAGVKCGGGKTELGQRCITSEGIVNGVKPGTRLQTLVDSKAGRSLFEVEGVLGLSEVKVSGSVKVPGLVASNGNIIGTKPGSAAFELGYELCEPGTFSPAAGSDRNRSGVTVHGVGGMEAAGPLWEKPRPSSECPFAAPLPTNHATATNNEDSLIGTTYIVEKPNYTWNEAKHELTLQGSSKLTLGTAGKSSKFYFCKFSMPSGGAQIKIPLDATVEIFIEKSKAEGGACESGGTFLVGGGDSILNEAKGPGTLLIEAAGKGPVAYENGSSTTLEASIYAPEAEIVMNGGIKFKGGIVGDKVHLEAGSGIFEWNSGSGGFGNGESTAYERKSWKQCTPGSGPETGC